MKKTIPTDFLKESFIDQKKYLPFDEEPEVKEALEKQVKDAWREIYAYAHTINRAGRQWNDTDVQHLGERLYIDGQKIRNVFSKVFDLNKAEFGFDDKPEIYKVEHFLHKHYDFIRNEITQRSEYKPKNADEFDKLNVNTIYRRLQHSNFKFGKDRLESLLKSDFMPSYNPMLEYFENLPAWDYETDYIGDLANFVQTTDQAFHVTQFRKMLVRSIGCALYGVENRFVYVFVGKKQESGKSTFIRFLNPFGTRYYTEAPIRDKADTYFAFCENFIYNLEELASASNIEVNHLKAIISTAMIKERKPYGVDAEEQPRRCNFWGSTNKDEFLIDDHNSRWLIAKVTGIDWSYKTKVDINKVWAQAFALYHDKDFDQQLTPAEMAVRDLTNKDFELTDVEKELIKQCFEIPAENDPERVYYTIPDIMTAISIKYNGKPLNNRFIGKSMVQLGFEAGNERINGHKSRGYWVKLKEKAAIAFEPYAPDTTPPPAPNPQATIQFVEKGKKLF